MKALLAGLLMAGAVHSGPYTVRTPVNPDHVLITFHGELCKHYAYDYLVLSHDGWSGAGITGQSRGDHLSFAATLSPGTWVTERINAGCTDGSYGSYDGTHTVITVP